MTAPMRTEVRIDRDLMRQMVLMQVQQMNMNTGEMTVAAYDLTERAARNLSEQLSDYNPNMRRNRDMEQRYESVMAELRSCGNQLEEVRNHNNTLSNTNDELQRQVRWLERELRDANQERRAAG
jgi:predicted RNase H-like nuclease (RuvC/YqgF family)